MEAPPAAPGLRARPRRPGLTCWPGTEDRQAVHSTLCSWHRSWHREPEMTPLWNWSHWEDDAGAAGRRGSGRPPAALSPASRAVPLGVAPPGPHAPQRPRCCRQEPGASGHCALRTGICPCHHPSVPGRWLPRAQRPHCPGAQLELTAAGTCQLGDVVGLPRPLEAAGSPSAAADCLCPAPLQAPTPEPGPQGALPASIHLGPGPEQGGR